MAGGAGGFPSGGWLVARRRTRTAGAWKRVGPKDAVDFGQPIAKRIGRAAEQVVRPVRLPVCGCVGVCVGVYGWVWLRSCSSRERAEERLRAAYGQEGGEMRGR